MILKTNPFYLFGIPIHNLTAQRNFDSFYDHLGVLYRTNSDTIFRFNLAGDEQIYQIHQQMINYSLQTIGLGHGSQCPYCSNYNPVGTAVCMRCGGLTETIEYVKPEPLKAILLEKTFDAGFVGDSIKCEFVFAMTTDDFNKLYQAVRADLYYVDSVELGLYMCQFCGSVVREGDDCHNCGGVRLPFSELVRIDHNCLYCGSKIRGNLFCDSCGASISGKTIRG